MLRATLKSLLARKLRLLLSGLAVVLGVMFVSGAFVLTDTLGRSFDALFAQAFESSDVYVSAAPAVSSDGFDQSSAGKPLPATLVETVAANEAVAGAAGAVYADGARLIGSNGKVVTSFGAPQAGQNWMGEGGGLELRSGREPRADDEILINAGLAEAARVSVGDRVGVLTREPKREFTLVGIVGYSGGRDSLGGSNEVFFTTPVAQQLMLGERDVYTHVTAQAVDGTSAEQLRDALASSLGGDYVVKTGAQMAAESSDGLKEGLSFFNKILLGFAGVALLVGTFLILNTFSIIVAQRTRELALLRAIGASRRQVVGSVLVEAIVIGLLASALGLAAGVGIGAALAYAFGQFAGGLTLAGLGVPAIAVYSSFGVGVLVTLLAALLPALRASRVPPIAAMQDVATPDRPLTRITTAGAVVLAAGAALLAAGLSDNAGDQALATILAGVVLAFIGTALLTPLISRPVVSALGAAFAWSVPGKLGRLNSGRNPRRTAITAAALMVGISLVTGITVVLDSAKSSVAAEVDEVLDAELVISGAQTGPVAPTFDATVLDAAAALPEVAVLAGIWQERALVDGQTRWVTASNDFAAAGRVFRAVPTAGVIATLRPDQVALGAGTAEDLGRTVGDTITVELAQGGSKRYEVSAVVPDDMMFGGVVLPVEAVAGFTVAQPMMALIKLNDDADADAALAKVEALLADSPEVSVVNRAGYVEQQLGVFDTLLMMIQILLALAIVIAVLGIVNTLILSVMERTRELGLLRAIGLQRAQMMRMVTVEAVVVSVFGALLGIGVGAAIGAVVVRALHDEGITDLVMPWQQMGLFVGLAALVGVVAAIIPAIRAARINVLAAIAHE